MQNLPGMPVGKPIGFKTLQEVSGYISVHDGHIIRITVNVMKLQKTEQKDPTGLPMYNIQTGMAMTVLTREEYEAMTKSDLSQ